MQRKKVSQQIADELLWHSDITCNLCNKEKRHLEIHHINQNSADGRYENLIVLCRNCHSEITERGLGRAISPTLLLRYKHYWEGVVRKRRTESASGDPKLEQKIIQLSAENLAKTFENYMVKRDAEGVLSLFTPPTTKAERDWLENYILGGDLGRPGQLVRLFATRGFGYKVLRYDIKKLKVISSKKVEVAVEEWRTWWDEGEWDRVPRRCRTLLTLVRIRNDWFVDKYREPSDPHYKHKYGGLGG